MNREASAVTEDAAKSDPLILGEFVLGNFSPAQLVVNVLVETEFPILH